MIVEAMVLLPGRVIVVIGRVSRGIAGEIGHKIEANAFMSSDILTATATRDAGRVGVEVDCVTGRAVCCERGQQQVLRVVVYGNVILPVRNEASPRIIAAHKVIAIIEELDGLLRIERLEHRHDVLIVMATRLQRDREDRAVIGRFSRCKHRPVGGDRIF